MSENLSASYLCNSKSGGNFFNFCSGCVFQGLVFGTSTVVNQFHTLCTNFFLVINLFTRCATETTFGTEGHLNMSLDAGRFDGEETLHIVVWDGWKQASAWLPCQGFCVGITSQVMQCWASVNLAHAIGHFYIDMLVRAQVCSRVVLQARPFLFVKKL
eukprot:2949965-Amphidinium_carterae.2